MPNPLRVLWVMANPSDLPRFDDARMWAETAEALPAGGGVVLKRLAEPTAPALGRALGENHWDAVHFVVHAQERRAANYGTIALESSDGRARNLTGQALANLVGEFASLRLVALEACDEASFCFDTVAGALQAKGLTVVVAPALARAHGVFTAKLYAAVAAGLAPEHIARDVAAATSGAVRVFSPNLAAPLFATEIPTPSALVAPAVVEPMVEPKSTVVPNRAQEELRRKRAAGEFDVFLCHSWADKPAVMRIAQQLKETGILPWLDIDELPPGQPWQRLLERQIETIKAAAVFVGAAGTGPWQEEEIDALLRVFKKRTSPVIPVLLPDAPSQPDLPLFLGARTWVDFRRDHPDPLKLLIWGITGRRPDD